MTGVIPLWRIAAVTHKYTAIDLSGAGAAANPGRWNDQSEHVVYCGESRAIAALETTAHLDAHGYPLNRYLVRIDVPEEVWERRIAITSAALPVTWDAVPAGIDSVAVGSSWCRAGASALLVPPSVIVPEECVILINAQHPDAVKISATAIRKFDFKPVIRSP